MPVNGLPPVLEKILNECIEKKKMSLWKVEGLSYKIQVTVIFDDKNGDLVNLERNCSCQNWNENLETNENEALGNNSMRISHQSAEITNSYLNRNQLIRDKVGSFISGSTIGQNVSHTIDKERVYGEAVLFTYEHVENANIDGNLPSSISDMTSSKENIDYFDKQSILANTYESPKNSASSSPIHNKKYSLSSTPNLECNALRALSAGNSPIRDNTKILSKVIKVMKRSATHCAECNKIGKQSTKSKCTVCDVFICSDCVYGSKHNPEHKKYISMFSYPTDVNGDYCRACGYVSKIKHSYNTNFSCDLCPEYLLCQGCMSQGMHGHHEEYLRPILLNKK